MTRLRPLGLLVVILLALPVVALAGETGAWESFLRLVTLRDYNTRIVLMGTTALGISAGVVGTFLLLRKRSLLADTVSHATLPGLCVAYLVGHHFLGDGRHLPLLLLGAVVSGSLGAGVVWLIRQTSLIKDDAALGIVLSVFFGVGIAMLGVLSRIDGASASGLETFIYGKPASMLRHDAILVALGGLGVIAACALLFKEFTLLCFDGDFSRAQGWSVGGLDLTLMVLIVFVTVIGLQAVGLILVVALLIVPAASARYWSHDLRRVALVAGLIGGAAGFLGTSISAIHPRSPAGAVIVLVAGSFFVLSLLVGPARGIGWRVWQQAQLAQKVGRQHVLRDLFESAELNPSQGGMTAASLLALRGGPTLLKNWCLARTRRDGLVERRGDLLSLTPQGTLQARRILRNHRLWELYLIHYADIAPSHVDRDADMVEHVLGPEMVQRLETLLAGRAPADVIPPSPHHEDPNP